MSAGLLMCRSRNDVIEFLLAHPGGPYFGRRDDGVWTLPKGMINPGEQPLAAAKREFEEETGFEVTAERFMPLGEIRQRSGKIVHAWAFWGDCDPSRISSNTFEVEWPPRSGQRREFPEVDRAEFFAPAKARQKLLRAQVPFIDRALEILLKPRR